MRAITDEQRRRRLAIRHLLTPATRCATVPDAADAVVALHSSDPASVYLAAAARMSDATVGGVERALYDARSVIRHHAMRRTLWVMTPDTAEIAHAACTRSVAARERRRALRLLACDPAWLDQAIDTVVAVVDRSGPITTREVGAALPDLATPLAGRDSGPAAHAASSPISRLLLLAAFEGRIVRARPLGSWLGTQYARVAAGEWSDIDWHTPDAQAAVRSLVERWLRRFGPGTVEDLTWWTGLSTTAVQTALTDLAAEPVALEAGEGFVAPDDPDEPDPGPWAALLPGLDPTAMGWKHRPWYLDPAARARVTDRNGNIGPTIWIDGRVVGGWVQRSDGTIATALDGVPTPHQRRMLDTEIDRLMDFLGEHRFRVRFPAPVQAALFS